MIEWNKGYEASYYMSVVDSATWRDIERIEITGGSITLDDDQGLRGSASLSCTDYDYGIEQWVRIWLDVEQSGSYDHVPLFTGLATSPKHKTKGTLVTNSLECYSVLSAVEAVDLLRGWYAPAGRRSGDIIRELLESSTPAPVIVEEDSPILEDYIIADDNETHLSMVYKILTSMGNWRLRVDGRGEIHVMPVSTSPVAVFDAVDNDVIETEIDIDNDRFSCPNVFIAIQDDLMAVARDENPNSDLSVDIRGREVWAKESGVQLMENETIEEYAARRLAESQKSYITAQYNRRFIPDVLPGDVVSIYYPNNGLYGPFAVSSQNIDLSYAAKTSETVIAGA